MLRELLVGNSRATYSEGNMWLVAVAGAVLAFRPPWKLIDPEINTTVIHQIACL